MFAALGAALAAVLIASPATAYGADAPGQDKPGHYGFAVIGDPYVIYSRPKVRGGGP